MNKKPALIKKMKYFFLLIFFILKTGQAADLNAKSYCVHDDNNFRCVKYIKNYDGDTIVFHIPEVHPLIGKKIRVRLLDIDTAEMNAKNKCEKKKAEEAQKTVENLLKKAKRIDLRNIKRDKYFRIVADVKVDDRSIGDYLIQNNLAYNYKKRKKQINWCEMNKNTVSSAKTGEVKKNENKKIK